MGVVVMPQTSNVQPAPLQSVVWLVAKDAGSGVEHEPLMVSVGAAMSRFFETSGLPSSAVWNSAAGSSYLANH